MSETLKFMMGEFEAEFPVDLVYAKNHMWARPAESLLRFGFSAYAVRLLQDVYFLDWTVEPATQVAHRQEIGAIESKKAESDLFAPIAGTLVTLNEALLSDPSYINVDKYNQGWLFEMTGATEQLLSAQEYVKHLEAVWEITQRTIKGQLN
ncbi:MAG: glycine cleavage system protein H [Pirellulaceae bacterium]|nr:glycine cleavage system protein H [Pirellulaceae bacterium]